MSLRAAFYRGTHAGLPGVYNRGVRWWTRSPYSHVELVFDDGMCGSASYMDGGVRLKRIEFDPTLWDIVDLPATLAPAARAWFEAHKGQPYDIVGNLHFIVSAIGESNGDWFCSEAAAAALGIETPSRFDPGTLRAALLLVQALTNSNENSHNVTLT